MPAVGPTLPPGMAEKRKRDESDGSSTSDDDRNNSPDSNSKKPRVMGPAMPPAPLDERPAENPPPTNTGTSDDASSDDDFGPALPTARDAAKKPSAQPAPVTTAPALQRDEWMTMAPTSGDWSSRVDPTQLKARKFNSGKGAKAPTASSGPSDAWHETPEQKQVRLQRELMGVKDKTTAGPAPSKGTTRSEDAATAEHIKSYNAARGPSLMDSHKKKHDREEDDDPSKRAFDREKDIAGGLQMNGTQRRDMMKKASDFNTRFSSSKYL